MGPRPKHALSTGDEPLAVCLWITSCGDEEAAVILILVVITIVVKSDKSGWARTSIKVLRSGCLLRSLSQRRVMGQ